MSKMKMKMKKLSKYLDLGHTCTYKVYTNTM